MATTAASDTRANTVEALECVWAHLPDVLLVDPMMEGMSGFDLCRQVRKHPETERIPIVLHTATAAGEPQGLYDCLCAGNFTDVR